MSSIITDITRWLLNQFKKLIDIRRDQLPTKALKADYPTVYWVEAPQHENFGNNLNRRKFNSALQAESSVLPNMKMMRMKKIWDPEDPQSYIASCARFTTSGIFKYWKSIDNALQFNDAKRQEYKRKAVTQQNAGKHFKFNNQRNPFKWSKPGKDFNRRRESRFEQDNKEETRYKLPRPPRSLHFENL